MTEKEKRSGIKKRLRKEEMIRYEEAIKTQSQHQHFYASVEIKDMQINDSGLLQAILAKLGAMQLKGEIKLVSGSFDLNSIVDAEFILKHSKERWSIHCLNDGAIGGGYLRKVGSV